MLDNCILNNVIYGAYSSHKLDVQVYLIYIALQIYVFFALKCTFWNQLGSGRQVRTTLSSR